MRGYRLIIEGRGMATPIYRAHHNNAIKDHMWIRESLFLSSSPLPRLWFLLLSIRMKNNSKNYPGNQTATLPHSHIYIHIYVSVYSVYACVCFMVNRNSSFGPYVFAALTLIQIEFCFQLAPQDASQYELQIHLTPIHIYIHIYYHRVQLGVRVTCLVFSSCLFGHSAV